MPNLCLSRKRFDTIHIGDAVVTVNEIRGDKVRLSIRAPRSVPVNRGEVHEAILREQAAKPPAPQSTEGVS